MKVLQSVSTILFSIIVLNGCSKEPIQVRVHNLNDKEVTITIKPATGTVKTIVAQAGETTQYIEIDPTNGGTISGSRDGTNPPDIDFYAFVESSYGITLSAGDNPNLSWDEE
ncbi:MAG: hypothetical protein OQK82_07180 [Candidatus Pacearchaeota archaeon]|nr:hypothetical protein [Candidatus Pacearchaeota archaeon]